MIRNNRKKSPPPPIIIPNPERSDHNSIHIPTPMIPIVPIKSLQENITPNIESNAVIPEQSIEPEPESEPIVEESMHNNPNYQIIINKLKMDILLYIRKINYDIGYYWWKAYIYSAFWNNISTPINLVIMILTALTTGHSATGSIVSESNNTTLGLVTLIISIFNTFFRPAQQMNESKENMSRWYKLGIDFEKIYYSKFQDFNVAELSKKVDELQKIFNDINELKRSQNTNFIIDLIFLLSKNYCIKRNLTWIPKNDREKESNTQQNTTIPTNPLIASLSATNAINDIVIPMTSNGVLSATVSNTQENNHQSSNQSNHSDESIVNVPIGAMDTINLFARKTKVNIQCRDIMV
jgi:hypothetical protein